MEGWKLSKISIDEVENEKYLGMHDVEIIYESEGRKI